MLWYKNWLETRPFVVFMTLYALFPVALFTLNPRPASAPQGSVAAVEAAIAFLPVYYSMIPALLAGSGIKAQAGLRTKGLHASTYFTLSLPISRFRLVATRSATRRFDWSCLSSRGDAVAASPFLVDLVAPHRVQQAGQSSS